MGTLDNAKAVQEANKRATLEAIAQYGSQGQAAYDQQLASSQAAQQQALAQTAAGAAGAPTGAAEYLQSIARMPGDAFQQSMTAAKARLAGDMTRMSAANTAYYDQYANALPGLEAQLAEAAAARAAAAAAGSGGGSKQPGRYGGYQTATEYENAVTAAARQRQEQVAGPARQVQQQAHNAVSDERFGGGAEQAYYAGQRKKIAAVRAQAKKLTAQALGQKFAFGARVGRGRTEAELRKDPAAMAKYALAKKMMEWANKQGDQGRSSQRQAMQQSQQRYAEAGPRVQVAKQNVQSIEDPRNLFEFAREVAINDMGGDQGDAMGRFSPEWAMGLASKQYSGPNSLAQQQLEYDERQRNGGYTDAEMLAKQRGDEFQGDQALRSSADYEGAVNIAYQLYDMASQGGRVTLDDLRAELARNGIDPYVANKVISEWSGTFPSASFYDNQQQG